VGGQTQFEHRLPQARCCCGPLSFRLAGCRGGEVEETTSPIQLILSNLTAITASRSCRRIARSLLARPGGDARAGNHRQNQVQQYENGQGYCDGHWILDSPADTRALSAPAWRRNATTRGESGEGSSQHTWRRRPHVRHSYWPCEGHIAPLCIHVHQRSAILAWACFIDSLPESFQSCAAL
jgi:hypothetical protein